MHASPATSLPAVPAHEQEQAAAFRAWVYTHGGRATRDPQAFMVDLPALRAGLAANDAPPGGIELTKAGLDLAEAVAQHRLANHAAVEPCAVRAREVFDRVARSTNNAALARELHLFSASCQMQVGNACYGQSLYADGLRAYSAAHERFALLGERKAESTVLRNMALCYEGSGLFHLAVEAGLAAREIAREINNEFELATHDNNLGSLYFELGDDEASRLCLERALRFFEKGDRDDYELQTLLQLARLDQRQGRLEEAFRLLERARAISTRIARRELEADRLKILGATMRANGRLAEARVHLERGAALAEEVDDADRIADLHFELGALAVSENRAGDAQRSGEAARAASTRHGQDGRLLPDILGVLADAARLRGDWQAAWQRERERTEATARAQKRAIDARARTLAVRHQLDLIRDEAEQRRMENLRLEEALSHVAARLDASEHHTAALPDPNRISALDLSPLGLRPRECEVLLWVVRGKSNDEIGTILGCSAETVKSHLKRIYIHLDVTNRTAAASSALARLATPAS